VTTTDQAALDGVRRGGVLALATWAGPEERQGVEAAAAPVNTAG
jgi:hypothetical protein